MKLNLRSVWAATVHLMGCCWYSPAEAADTCFPAPPGLVSWWRAESGVMDTLGFNHGVNMGGVAFTPGKVGQAFSFNGAANSSITISNSPSLLPASGHFTIDAWIKPDFAAANLTDTIFAKRDGCDSANISYLLVIAKAGLSGFSVGEVILVMTTPGTGSGAVQLSSGNTQVVPADNQFHHVAATYDGALAKIYLDGQFVGQAVRTGPITPSIAPAEIGGHGGTCTTRSVAAMDEVEFLDRALTAADIQAMFAAGSAGKCSDVPYFITSTLPDGRAGAPYATTIQARLGTPPYVFSLTSGTLGNGLTLGADGVLQGSPQVAGTNTLTIRVSDSFGRSADRDFLLRITPCLPIPSGLVAYWPFNGDTMDRVGTNHGTIEDSPYFTNGISGMGLFFKGTVIGADQVRVKHSPELSFETHDPMSVSIWVHPVDQNVGHIFGKRLPQCTAGNEINYQMVFDGRPSVGFGPLGSTAATDRELPLGAWTHLAATFDGTTMTFYFNGIEAARDTTHFLGPTNQYDLLIGGSGLCEHFRGIIDELAIYRRALSADEITALFVNQGRPLSTNTTPPVMTCPSNIVVNTDLGQPSSSNVTYPVTATDNCSGVTIASTCNPPSGSTFPLGTNLVTCTATDSSGNTNSCSFTVTVRDEEPPQITCPSNVTVQCDANVPAPNPATVTATDNCSPAPVVVHVNDVPFGNCPKVITRTYRATDANGNVTTCTQTITVQDTIAPVVICPPSVTIAAQSNQGGAAVSFSVSANDGCEGIVPVACSAVPGFFAIGTTSVTCEAVDGCSNRGACSFTITVTNQPTVPTFGRCSFTQGFYGNAKGKFNGTPSLTLVGNLLEQGPLIVGKLGARSLSIEPGEATLLQQRLPSGGTPATLPDRGEQTLATAVLPLNAKGRFANVLLGQTITLSLNVRLSPALSTVGIAPAFCTQGMLPGPDGLKGTDDDLPMSGDGLRFNIANSVRLALTDSVLGVNDSTVRGLLELANRGLAAQSTGGAGLSEINDAVDAINRGFDECRVLVDCTTSAVIPDSFNDSFVNRPALSSGSIAAAAPDAIVAAGAGSGNARGHVSNLHANKEPGEPNHGGNRGGKSVWWRWLAPRSGIVLLQTTGSSFDTLLAVYTGSSLSNLVLIAGNDDRPDDSLAELSFEAQAGTEYQIAVDGYEGGCGTVLLRLIIDQPRLCLPLIRNGSNLELCLDGSMGRTYTIEASSDLTIWTPIASVLNTDGTLRFTDSGTAGNSQRFYRLQSDL